MANELHISASFSYTKSSTSLSLSTGGLQVTVSGTAALQNRQSVGTSEEALLMGDVTSPGYIILINRDATNYVEVRPATGAADLVRLNAGEVALFRLAADATAPYVIANTAAVEVVYILLSD